MRVALLAFLLIACGSPRPAATPAWTPPEPLDERWRPAPLVGIQPLPTALALLDLDPDPVDWRWPLPRAPQLLPSGELAAMFGTKAEWATLCAARGNPRGVDRDEALAYLRAWCDATPDLALAKALVPLIKARTSEIAAAATIDLAAVLESQLAAREALEWLRFHGAYHDFVLDAMAASYLATDRLDDTRFVVKALKPYRAYSTLECRRMFRELFVAERDRRDAIRLSLSLSSDAVCSRLSAHANCTLSWGIEARGAGLAPARLDLDRCTPLLLDRPELLPQAYLTIAAAHWPAESRSFEVWLAYAMFSAGAAGAPRADELIVAAFTNALRLSDCERQLELVVDVVSHSTLPRVRQLRTLTPSECRRQQGSPPR